jgi:hypothetical protein
VIVPTKLSREEIELYNRLKEFDKKRELKLVRALREVERFFF